MLRHKTRLIAKEFVQIPGISFTKVFSSLSKHTALRLLLALAVKHEWSRALIHVKNSFFNASLKDDIYVQQPEEFLGEGRGDFFYRLDKALYGLRQALREWNGD